MPGGEGFVFVERGRATEVAGTESGLVLGRDLVRLAI